MLSHSRRQVSMNRLRRIIRQHRYTVIMAIPILIHRVSIRTRITAVPHLHSDSDSDMATKTLSVHMDVVATDPAILAGRLSMGGPDQAVTETLVTVVRMVAAGMPRADGDNPIRRL